MIKLDYKLYNTVSFRSFLKKHINENYKTPSALSRKIEIIDLFLEKETAKLTAKTFFNVIKSLELDLKIICNLFFKTIPSTKLKSIKSSKNKLENLLGPYFNSKLELVTASGIKETTLNELFDNKFDRIYAYELSAIAISFGIEPHVMFNYFYGDGERPIIGLT
ncbi:hypothetical protein [Sphingobacterium sp.]|uniref:hypothetical protein n=1 Tax=Sphingobacterium sp. TaxID=341027 RepID=UPI0028A0D1BB|nr:hypothetical protein [Sphingobacterium sp.]